MTDGIAWIAPFEPTRPRHRWLVATVGSIAFHAVATVYLWPTIEEFSIGSASGATVIALDLSSIEDAGAAQATPPESKNIDDEPVAEVPFEPATIEESILMPPAVVHPLPSRKPTPIRQPKPTAAPADPSPRDTQAVAEAPAPIVAEGTSIQTAALTATAPRTLSDDAPIVVHDPKFMRRPSPPTYPARAVELDQQGVVFIRALVTVPGKPEKTVVWQSSGFPLLDSAAMAAVSRWEFEPLRRAGEVRPAWVQIPVKFRLNQTTIQ